MRNGMFGKKSSIVFASKSLIFIEICNIFFISVKIKLHLSRMVSFLYIRCYNLE